MHTPELLLYVKSGCPWCDLAEDYLNEHGYKFRRINVCRDRASFEEMRRISGQTYAPTLVVGDEVLPDFGPEELHHFLKANEIQHDRSNGIFNRRTKRTCVGANPLRSDSAP